MDGTTGAAAAMLVVILAGGEGRRMGGAKPLRRMGGETLIARATALARSWASEVRLAVRSAGQVLGSDLPLLSDDPAIEGPLAGLKSALVAARSTGAAEVLTIPCDAPFLPGDLAPRLRAARAGKGAAVAASGGQLHPTCALWDARSLDALPAYLARGRRSLAGFAEAVGLVAVDWPERCFVNVNTPDDLAAAERRLRSEVEGRNGSAGA